MAQRECSCCGENYDDDVGHNLDACIENCKYGLNEAERTSAHVFYNLERAYGRRIAALKWQLSHIVAEV